MKFVVVGLGVVVVLYVIAWLAFGLWQVIDKKEEERNKFKRVLSFWSWLKK